MSVQVLLRWPGVSTKPFLAFAFWVESFGKMGDKFRHWLGVSCHYPSSCKRGVFTLMLKGFNFHTATKLAALH